MCDDMPMFYKLAGVAGASMAPPNPPLLLAHDPRAFLRCRRCGQPIIRGQPVVVMNGCSVGKSECLSFAPFFHVECVDRPNCG